MRKLSIWDKNPEGICREHRFTASMKLNRLLFYSAALALAAAGATLTPTISFAHGDEAAGQEHTGDSAKFTSIGQAWTTIKDTADRVSKAIASGDLKSIHGETELMDTAIKYMRSADGITDPDKKARAEGALKQMLTLGEDLHTAADAGEAAKSAQTLKRIQSGMRLIEMQYPPETLRPPAEISKTDHGGHEMHSATAKPTITATVATAGPLTIGEKAQATLKLTKRDGSPVLVSDLKQVHARKIHLLINDASLSDYHHEHPEPTGVPGEYAFTFIPKKPGPYRVWVDLLPLATDIQEYVIADIAAPTKGEPINERTPKAVIEMEGLKYEISFETPELKAGRAALGRLKITNQDGEVFTQLEPVMGAYSHIVGFAEDFKTIAHIHPMGIEPTVPTDRGAGELEFHLLPAQPGIMRLYAQVQINGKSKFAPFTLSVSP